MKALVVFQDDGRHALSPLLKRGFRHVSVAVLDRQWWIAVDPGLGTPRPTVYCGADFDLRAHAEAAGNTVVEAETRDIEPVMPLRLANCVGIVKAVLGVRAPHVITPYQLYRHLTRKPT